MFFRDIERDQWHEMGEAVLYFHKVLKLFLNHLFQMQPFSTPWKH